MILNANTCTSLDGKVLFDTNVWISIEGLNGNSRIGLQKAYSDLLSRLQKSSCEIVTNNYIIGEFYNRCCKMQYNSAKSGSVNPRRFMQPKEYRKTDEGLRDAEYARDLALQIIEDCSFEYIQIQRGLSDLLAESAKGHMDLNDIILREHCLEKGYALATHDEDYHGCGLKIVTANPRLLNA